MEDWQEYVLAKGITVEQQWTDLADKLDAMQNAAGGIPTVKSIADKLHIGDVAGAENMYHIDGDKLHSCPEIEAIIKTELLDRQK